MGNILVTGALGQIGSELVVALRQRFGAERVIASDIRMLQPEARVLQGRYELVDCTQPHQIHEAMRRHDIATIYHMAALLVGGRGGQAADRLERQYGRALQRP